MYFPSNNWYVVRRNCVGTWQVEAQQGCFYIPCPTRYKANQVRDYLMKWLRDQEFFRLGALVRNVSRLLAHEISFDDFYATLVTIHSRDIMEF